MPSPSANESARAPGEPDSSDKSLLVEAMLAEYRSVRQESLEAVGHRMTVMSFTFAAVGVVIGGLLARRVSDVLAGLIAILFVPQVSKAALLIWLGEYDRTESLIRQLLSTRKVALAAATRARDTTPADVITPESYLGYQRLDRYAGSEIAKNREATYRFPSRLAANELAYSGRWRVESERIVARHDARLRLRYQARNVYLVLGGKGRVQTLLDGKPARTVTVDGDRLYTLVSDPAEHQKLLELRFTSGLSAYAFTFG